MTVFINEFYDGDMVGQSEFEDGFEDAALPGEFLRMTLKELPRRPLLSLPPTATIADAIQAMNDKRVGAVLLMEGNTLAGIFTERDVLKRVALSGIDVRTTSVSTVMTKKPDMLPSDAGVAYALRKMNEEGYRHIPIVDKNGKATGIVAVRDIVRWLVELFPEELNLPPDPSLESRSVDGG